MFPITQVSYQNKTPSRSRGWQGMGAIAFTGNDLGFL
jgi:hypothetical protein